MTYGSRLMGAAGTRLCGILVHGVLFAKFARRGRGPVGAAEEQYSLLVHGVCCGIFARRRAGVAGSPGRVARRSGAWGPGCVISRAVGQAEPCAEPRHGVPVHGVLVAGFRVLRGLVRRGAARQRVALVHEVLVANFRLSQRRGASAVADDGTRLSGEDGEGLTVSASVAFLSAMFSDCSYWCATGSPQGGCSSPSPGVAPEPTGLAWLGAEGRHRQCGAS